MTAWTSSGYAERPPAMPFAQRETAAEATSIKVDEQHRVERDGGDLRPCASHSAQPTATKASAPMRTHPSAPRRAIDDPQHGYPPERAKDHERWKPAGPIDRRNNDVPEPLD
jgi:hypothetical protein